MQTILNGVLNPQLNIYLFITCFLVFSSSDSKMIGVKILGLL